MKFVKTAVCSLAMVAAITATASVSTAKAATDTLSDVLKAGVVKVAVPQDFPPFGTIGKDMQPAGYDIDMAKLIADKLDVKIKLVPVTSANRIPYLTTGKVDLVISSLGKNKKRAEVVDFSNPYAPFFNGVFGSAKLAVSKPAELKGHSVGVTRGSLDDLSLTDVAPEGTDIKRFEDNSGAISAYLSGQVELISTGNVVAAAIAEKNPDTKTKFLVKNSPCYIAVNKEQPALLKKVNEIIAGAKADGALNAISLKWLKNELPAEL